MGILMCPFFPLLRYRTDPRSPTDHSATQHCARYLHWLKHLRTCLNFILTQRGYEGRRHTLINISFLREKASAGKLVPMSMPCRVKRHPPQDGGLAVGIGLEAQVCFCNATVVFLARRPEESSSYLLISRCGEKLKEKNSSTNIYTSSIYINHKSPSKPVTIVKG